MTALDVASINEFQDVYAVLQLMDPPSTEYTHDEDDLEVISHETIIQLHWIRNLSNPDTLIERYVLNLRVVKCTNMAFGTDRSVLFREVSFIQEYPYRVIPPYTCTLYQLLNCRTVCCTLCIIHSTASR